MGRFNLNNATDFARATNSFGAGILQTFTGTGNSAWVIEEGAYKSGINPENIVIFHVFRSATDYQGALSQISDSGGRRKAKFLFPYVDGQLTEDLGRMPETFTLDIILHGSRYQNAFAALLRILNEPVPGTLVHPVRGEIRCAMESYELIHQESQRKAVAIRLTMVEHSVEPLVLRTREDKSAPSKLQKLTAAFSKIERVINKVQSVSFLVTSVKNQIIQGLQEYQKSYAKVAGNMNATFNPGGAPIPALLPVTEGGLQGEDGEFVTNATTIAVSPSDPFAQTPIELTDETLQTALAIEQISKDIESTRGQVSELISTLETSGDGEGAFEFYDNIIELRETANDLQDAFEAGKQSSQVTLIEYTTPRLMSVREVAFDNGLSPDDAIQVAYLNPELESLNYIPRGTVLKVALT
jgi:hypothetical protein